MRTGLSMLAVVGAAAGFLYALDRRRKTRNSRQWNQVAPGSALITGASSGIGAAFACALAREGYDLVLLARREERLRELAEKITRQYPVQVEIFTADLADPVAVERAARRVAAIPDLDVLVNNAGFGLGGTFANLDIESSLGMVQVHLHATKQLIWAALPIMIARERGGIVNVSSLIAFAPGVGDGTYGATKAYLNYFSEALAGDLQGSGVRIQALCPGLTYTEFHNRSGRPAVPGFMWMDAGQVVDESLRGLREGRLVVIPGRVNQALALAARLPFIRQLARQVRALVWRGRLAGGG